MKNAMTNAIFCPICRSDDVSFFSKHNKVSQNLYTCRSCGLFFVHPHLPVIPGGEGDAFSEKQENFWGTDTSINLYLKWRATENQRVVNLIKTFGPAEKVLEIGFGDGALTKHLLKMTNEYWGIEPGADCLANTVHLLNLDPGKTFCIKAEDMAATELLMAQRGTFDLIVLVSVLEHLSIPARILETCHTLLKPGGRLFLSTPNSRYFRIFYGLRRLAGIDSWSVAHISFFNKTNLVSMVEDIGFAVDDISLAPLITADSIRYFREMYKSRLLGVFMAGFKLLGLDRVLNINTFNVVLHKKQ